MRTVVLNGHALSVQKTGKHNCMVNMTEMAKGFGKRPIDWLKLESTKALIESIKGLEMSQSEEKHFGNALLITRKGGEPGYAGTWCTDMRIAYRFGDWLSPAYGNALFDALLQLTGEKKAEEPPTIRIDDTDWVNAEDYCRLLKKNLHCFYGLLGNYAQGFMYRKGEWYMSRELYGVETLRHEWQTKRAAMQRHHHLQQVEWDFEKEIGVHQIG